MSMELLALLNNDKLYQNTINKKVVICDTSSFTSSKQMADFMKFVFSNGDIGVALGASCECGKSEGIYLLNTTCPYCKTVVEKPTAQNLKYSSWIEIPDFLPPLLQPAAYRDLKTWMGTFNKSSLLLLLMTQNSILPECISSWYTPGLWSFYYNFDKLVEFLLVEYKPLKEPNIDKKTKTVNEKSLYIREFVTMYRECLFARYFPILDQRMHVKNNQGTMSFVDKASEQIVKSIIELANIHYHYTESKMEYIEKCAIDMINSYYEYSDTILSTKIQKKLGLIRRHILGARCHFTYRGVIVPITDAADGDELYLPWGIGVQQHKLEILNILVNRMGYTSHDAQMLYERSKYKYDPIIDGILDTLIKECPYKGLVTILGRNPTLNHGAIQLFFVTKIKKDDSDDTISISPLCIQAPNADFDGDALYGSMIKEMDDVPNYFNLHPMTTMLTEDELKISNNVNIGEQICVNLNSWMNEPCVA